MNRNLKMYHYHPYLICILLSFVGISILGWYRIALPILISIVPICLFLLLIIPPFIKFRKHQFDIFEPVNLFSLIYGNIMLLTPLSMILWQESQGLDSSILLKTLLLGLMGLSFYYLGYYSPYGSHIAKRLPAFPGNWNKSKLVIFTVLIVIVTNFTSVIILYRKGILFTFFSTDYRTQWQLNPEHSYFSIIRIWALRLELFSVLLSYCLTRVHKRDPSLSFLGWTYIVVRLLFHSLLWNRGGILNILLCILTFRNYAEKKLSGKAIILFFILILMVAAILGRLRQYGSFSMLNYDTVLQTLNARELATRTFIENGDFIIMNKTLVDMIEGVPQKLDYQYGKTYLMSFVYLIPRAAWSGKPMSASILYLTKFYPIFYEGGGGLRCFILAEAYMNFGYMGMAVMLMYGFFHRLLYAYLIRNRSNKSAILFYAISLPLAIIDFTRGDFLSATYSYIQGAFIPCVLGLAYFSYWPRRQNAKSTV